MYLNPRSRDKDLTQGRRRCIRRVPAPARVVPARAGHCEGEIAGKSQIQGRLEHGATRAP